MGSLLGPQSVSSSDAELGSFKSSSFIRSLPPKSTSSALRAMKNNLIQDHRSIQIIEDSCGLETGTKKDPASLN